MTIPAPPPPHGSSRLRIHYPLQSRSERKTTRRIVLYVVIFVILFLWSFAYLNLHLHVATPDDHDVPQQQHSSNHVRSSNSKKKTHDDKPVSSKLPLWKKEKNKSADVALTGSFRYRETSECQHCNLYFPADDLKVVLEKDEAVEFMKTGVMPSEMDASSVVHGSMQSTHALLTRGGNKDLGLLGVKANQDRSLFLSPFEYTSKQQQHSSKDDFVLGLFDGHGNDGHLVSHHVALELVPVLTKHLVKSKPSEALTKTCMELEKTMPPAEGAGTTAIVMLRLHDTLHVANVGDSLAFVASCDKDGTNASIVYQTKPHKPNVPQERKRIESLGGQVIAPQGPGDSWRVVIPVGDDIENSMALAMSRSIGDVEGTSLGVIAEPTVDSLELKRLSKPEKRLFAVAASDGLFDHVPASDVATVLANSLFGSSRKTPLEACELLIMRSSRKWLANGMPYRDDITVATTVLI